MRSVSAVVCSCADAKSHGLTIDGVHDVFMTKCSKTNFTYHPLETSIVIFAFVITVSCVWLNTKIIRQRVFTVLAKYEISDLALVIVFCVLISQAIDTFEWRIFAYRTVEECLELNAAAALMACSFKCRQASAIARIS